MENNRLLKCFACNRDFRIVKRVSIITIPLAEIVKIFPLANIQTNEKSMNLSYN